MRYCRLLSFFDKFSCQIWSSHICLKKVVKKLTESFFVISSRVIITCIAKEYSREYFFLEGILSKQVTKSAGESWNNMKLTSGIFFQSCVSNVISNQEKICLYWASRTLTVAFGVSNSLYFWQIIYLKFFLMYKSIKFFGKPLFLKIHLRVLITVWKVFGFFWSVFSPNAGKCGP